MYYYIIVSRIYKYEYELNIKKNIVFENDENRMQMRNFVIIELI